MSCDLLAPASDVTPQRALRACTLLLGASHPLDSSDCVLICLPPRLLSSAPPPNDLSGFCASESFGGSQNLTDKTKLPHLPGSLCTGTFLSLSFGSPALPENKLCSHCPGPGSLVPTGESEQCLQRPRHPSG